MKFLYLSPKWESIEDDLLYLVCKKILDNEIERIYDYKETNKHLYITNFTYSQLKNFFSLSDNDINFYFSLYTITVNSPITEEIKRHIIDCKKEYMLNSQLTTLDKLLIYFKDKLKLDHKYKEAIRNIFTENIYDNFTRSVFLYFSLYKKIDLYVPSFYEQQQDFFYNQFNTNEYIEINYDQIVKIDYPLKKYLSLIFPNYKNMILQDYNFKKNKNTYYFYYKDHNMNTINILSQQLSAKIISHDIIKRCVILEKENE